MRRPGGGNGAAKPLSDSESAYPQNRARVTLLAAAGDGPLPPSQLSLTEQQVDALWEMTTDNANHGLIHRYSDATTRAGWDQLEAIFAPDAISSKIWPTHGAVHRAVPAWCMREAFGVVSVATIEHGQNHA